MCASARVIPVLVGLLLDVVAECGVAVAGLRSRVIHARQSAPHAAPERGAPPARKARHLSSATRTPSSPRRARCPSPRNQDSLSVSICHWAARMGALLLYLLVPFGSLLFWGSDSGPPRYRNPLPPRGGFWTPGSDSGPVGFPLEVSDSGTSGLDSDPPEGLDSEPHPPRTGRLRGGGNTFPREVLCVRRGELFRRWRSVCPVRHGRRCAKRSRVASGPGRRHRPCSGDRCIDRRSR